MITTAELLSQPGPEKTPLEEQADTDPDWLYARIAEAAHQQGRETPDGIVLDGLRWQEGEQLKSEVTGHVKLEQYAERVLRRSFTDHHLHGFGFHGKPKKTEVVETMTWLHVVKSHNQYGDLVASETLTDEELAQRFRQARQKIGDTLWLPTPDTANQPLDREHVIPVTIASKDDVKILEEIDSQRWHEKLPDWTGLTWNFGAGKGYRRADTDIEGQGYRSIVDDNIVMEIVDGKQQPPKRLFTVHTVDAFGDGVNKIAVVDGLQLAQLIREDAYRDLRFVTSPPIRATVTDREDTEVSGSRAISRDEAISLLDYHDVLDLEDQELEKKMLWDTDAGRQDIKMLQELVADIGKTRVEKLAKQLHQAYLTDARRLDLLQHDTSSRSISWIILALARLHNYAKAPPEETPALALMRGNVGWVDPFPSDPADDGARYKQREIIDLRLGRAFASRVLRLTQEPVAGRTVEVEEAWGTDLKQIKKLKPSYRIDMAFTNSLQDVTKRALGLADYDTKLDNDRRADELGKFARGERGPLGAPEFITWGRILRWSVGSESAF